MRGCMLVWWQVHIKFDHLYIRVLARCCCCCGGGVAESGSVDERRYSEDTASLLSNNEVSFFVFQQRRCTLSGYTHFCLPVFHILLRARSLWLRGGKGKAALAVQQQCWHFCVESLPIQPIDRFFANILKTHDRVGYRIFSHD